MRRLTRDDWLSLAGVALLLVVLYTVYRVNSKELSVNIADCQPRDVWARISRAYDPLDFWIVQHTRLEDSFTQEDLDYALRSCEVMTRAEPHRLEHCLSNRKKLWDQGVRCLDHAAEMCRFEGGRC